MLKCKEQKNPLSSFLFKTLKSTITAMQITPILLTVSRWFYSHNCIFSTKGLFFLSTNKNLKMHSVSQFFTMDLFKNNHPFKCWNWMVELDSSSVLSCAVHRDTYMRGSDGVFICSFSLHQPMVQIKGIVCCCLEAHWTPIRSLK